MFHLPQSVLKDHPITAPLTYLIHLDHIVTRQLRGYSEKLFYLETKYNLFN